MSRIERRIDCVAEAIEKISEIFQEREGEKRNFSSSSSFFFASRFFAIKDKYLLILLLFVCPMRKSNSSETSLINSYIIQYSHHFRQIRMSSSSHRNEHIWKLEGRREREREKKKKTRQMGCLSFFLSFHVQYAGA